jgi:hypothetical protein
MAKYDELKEYLRLQPGNRVTLRFADIEDAIRGTLPKSAHLYPAWWANETNGRHTQARAWIEAGWLVDEVRLTAKSVAFVREGERHG